MDKSNGRRGTRKPAGAAALPEPTVVEAREGTLVPPNATNGVEVRLPDGVNPGPGDTVILGFGGGALIAPPGEAGGRFSAAQIARSIGKHVDVYYIIRKDSEDQESERLALYFAPLQDQDPLMPSPRVQEAAGGAIDLRSFEGDAMVEVPPWPFFTYGQHVKIDVVGTWADGSAAAEELAARVVVIGDEAGIYATLPRDLLGRLKDGSDVVVEAGVVFDPLSAEARRFRFPIATYVLVADEASPTLAPPRILQAVAGFIDPADVPDGAMARVAANPSIVPGTRVTLVMHGVTLDGVPVGHEVAREVDDDTLFPLDFPIPAEKIFVLGGSTADFYYILEPLPGRVARVPQRVRQESGIRTYGIVSMVPSLPPPIVDRAQGGHLDPDLVDDREGVKVDVTYPGIADGDVVSLAWRGPGTSPYSDTLTVFASEASFFVPKEPYVTDNIGEVVHLEYVALFSNGRGERSRPLALRIAKLERFIDFEDCPDKGIIPGMEIHLANGSVVLRVLAGSATIQPESKDYGAHTDGQVLVVPPLNRIAFDTTLPFYFVQFGIGSLSEVDIDLYDADGNLVHTEKNVQTGGRDFAYRSNVPLTRITVISVAGVHLDHIVLEGAASSDCALQGVHRMDNEPAQLLPAPHVPQIFTEGWLMPHDASGGVDVELSADVVLPDDTVTAYFADIAKIIPQGALYAHFEPGEIAHLLGTEPRIGYTVDRQGKRLDSERLHVLFLRYGDGDVSLPWPVVDERNGDHIDLGLFPGDATATVEQWPFYTYGQYLWVSVSGIRPDGSIDRMEVISEYASGDFRMSGPIPRSFLEGLENLSQVRVEARVTFDQSGDPEKAILFPVSTYRLIKQIETPELPEPLVTGATAGTLLPPNALDGVEVVLPTGVEPPPGDSVTVWFDNWVLYMDPSTRSVHLDPALIARSIGKHIEVYYIIRRAGESHESRRLQLYFAPLQDEDPLLPSPVVDKAVDGVIDLSTFDGDATTTVSRWPFFALEQFIWIHILGTAADGSSSEVTLVARRVTNTDEDGVVESLPRELLSSLQDGSEMVVEVRAAFHPQIDEATAFRFPRARYTLIVDGAAPTLEAPWVEEAVGEFIDPTAVRQGATARVAAHEAISAGTRVTLVMHGITSDGDPVGHEASRRVDEGTSLPLDFVVPGEKFFALADSTVDFYYVVEAEAPEGGQAHTDRSPKREQSQTRTYRIVGVVPSLPPPVVDEAADGYLDPDLVDDQQGVKVRVENEGIANGDMVAFTWRGTDMSMPYVDRVTVFAGSAIFFVPKDPYVIGNDGASASLEYVAYYADGDAARSHSLLLQIARAHEPELVIDLEDVAEQYLIPEQTLSLGNDAVELRVDGGTLVIFDTPTESPPYYVGRVAQVGGGGRLTLTLAAAKTWFELGFEVQGQGGATIRAYDSEERPVFESRISEPGARWVRYDGAAPAQQIVIDVDNIAVFDNLRLG